MREVLRINAIGLQKEQPEASQSRTANLNGALDCRYKPGSPEIHYMASQCGLD